MVGQAPAIFFGASAAAPLLTSSCPGVTRAPFSTATQKDARIKSGRGEGIGAVALPISVIPAKAGTPLPLRQAQRGPAFARVKTTKSVTYGVSSRSP